jgi:3-hydroxyisobutyrate dehydrogenase-like beta-hydroxyacid dehydrogenase
MTTISVLHPGEMGVSVAAAAMAAGNDVLWTDAGRSAATIERARRAELPAPVSMATVSASSDLILSVCPPHAALVLARSVLAAGFRGIFVDANAVSPDTAREIAALVAGSGAEFVDGGIIGPPAWGAGSTRLYLSGSEAATVAALFSGSLLDARVVGDAPGAASALKMAYAAWTKGTAAVLLAIRALARAEGVDESLLQEWGISQQGLAERSAAAAAFTARKAWRFVGEMEEIAATFEGVGLPGGFHTAAAEIYRCMESFKDADPLPSLKQVLDRLTKSA